MSAATLPEPAARSAPGAEPSPADGRPIAIVAGGGALPFEAAAAMAPRRPVLVLTIEGEADPPPADPPYRVHAMGFHQLGMARRLMREAGCTDFLWLGTVKTRPDLPKLLGDWETMRLLPKVIRAVVGGDDTVLRNLIALVEAEGFRIVPVAEAAPELLAPAGVLTRCAPGEGHREDIALGTRFLDAAAGFDIGQAVAVAQGRIVAVEAAEGTDAMLERVASVRASRRMRTKRGAGCLVKRAKRGQDMRADVPVVGTRTLEKVLEAGLGGIALEAGRTIIAGREGMLKAADRAGVFVVAV